MNRMNLTAFRIASVASVTAKAALMEGREFIRRTGSNVFHIIGTEHLRGLRAVTFPDMRGATWVRAARREPGMSEHARHDPLPKEPPVRIMRRSILSGLPQVWQMPGMGPFRRASCLGSLRPGKLVAAIIMTAILGMTPMACRQAIPVRVAARKVRRNLH